MKKKKKKYKKVFYPDNWEVADNVTEQITSAENSYDQAVQRHCRPDMTFAVEWFMVKNQLSIYPKTLQCHVLFNLCVPFQLKNKPSHTAILVNTAFVLLVYATFRTLRYTTNQKGYPKSL